MKRITFLLIFLALVTFGKKSDAQVLEADSLALVDIYNAADGANWTGVEKWLVDSVSNWEGVIVENNRVVDLRLIDINFGGNGGTLSPSIGNLTELTRFEIQYAPTLTGSIPAELWNCTKIGRLQLKYTGLTGGIPAGIESMVNAYELNFQQTYLGGPIPAQLFQLPSLTKAYLHQSNFTGTVPSTVTGATGLVRLYLQENKLEGPLPFVDLPDGQAKVQLTGNFFSYDDVKQYHDSAATFASFTDDYQFSKETTVAVVEPGAGYTMTGTVTGGEAYAWFKDDGTIPVGTSETLDIAAVGYNDEGTYTCKAQSSQVANFDIRTVYELSANYSGRERDSLALVAIYEAGDGANWLNTSTWLTDSIDKWEGVVVTGGRVTELYFNQMNFGGNGGTLSPKIGQLTELTRFEIQDAPNLSGSIPAELWNCTKIGRLQLKFTGLTGGIPAGIESMVNAYELNFQQSYLGGEIPAELFELPSLTKAYLHQSNFTGTVPSTVTGATGLVRLYLQENKLEGPLPFVDLPDGQAKVQLTGNFFTFDDVIQYHDSATTFAAFTDDYQLAQEDQHFTLDEGDSVAFEFYVKDGESYAWFYSSDPSPVSSDTIYTISSVVPTDTGAYVCKVQSSLVSNFDIRAIFVIDTVNAEIVPDSPQLQSAASSEDGTTVSLTFDLDIADPSAEAANFAFTEGGTAITVSSVSLDATDSKVVVLTLETAINSSSAALQVSYTPGNLQSSEGGMVEAFGPTDVTNNYVTGVNENIASTIKVYPNPFTDYITISSSSDINSVSIMDITGKIVWSQTNLSGTTLSLSIQDINSGIYFMSVESQDSNFIQKITKK